MRFIFNIPFFFLCLFSPFFLSAQCYTNNNVQASSPDTDCSNGDASLVILLDSGSGTGNACLIVSYTAIGGFTINQEYPQLSVPTEVTINNVDCNGIITLTPKTAPNCKGTTCAESIIYPDISSFISASLPVEMSHFIAKENEKMHVELNWATAVEIDNDHFIIERKTKSETWVEIGRVKGSGNSSTQIEYDFVDRSPENAINYYRIVDVDFSGIMARSKEIAVDMRDRLVKIEVFPIPAKDFVNVSGVEKGSRIVILNLDGKLLLSQLSNGNKIQLSTEELNEGIYVLAIQNEDFSTTKKLIINKRI